MNLGIDPDDASTVFGMFEDENEKDTRPGFDDSDDVPNVATPQGTMLHQLMDDFLQLLVISSRMEDRLGKEVQIPPSCYSYCILDFNHYSPR